MERRKGCFCDQRTWRPDSTSGIARGGWQGSSSPYPWFVPFDRCTNKESCWWNTEDNMKMKNTLGVACYITQPVISHRSMLEKCVRRRGSKKLPCIKRIARSFIYAVATQRERATKNFWSHTRVNLTQKPDFHGLIKNAYKKCAVCYLVLLCYRISFQSPPLLAMQRRCEHRFEWQRMKSIIILCSLLLAGAISISECCTPARQGNKVNLDLSFSIHTEET